MDKNIWKLIAAVVFITAVAGFAEYFQLMMHPNDQLFYTILIVVMACLVNASAIWRYSKKQEKLGKQEKPGK